MSKIDLEGDALASLQGEGEIATITRMVHDLMDSNKKITETEAELKALKEKRDRLESLDLPEMMDTVGLSDLKLPSGEKVVIKAIIKASLPADGSIERATGDKKQDLIERKAAGIQWLKENGAGSLIDNIVSARLGVDSEEEAQKAIDALVGLGLDVLHSQNVHPGRLSKFIRECYEAGKVVPANSLTVYTGRKATITKAR